MLQHLADGPRRPHARPRNTGPVYPWFGKDIRDGIPLAIENYALLHKLWREHTVDWQGKYRTPLPGLHLDAAAAGWTCRRSSGTAASARPRSPSRPRYYGDGFFANNIFWPKEHYMKLIGYYRQRFEHYGHGAADQAIVGLGGQAFMRARSQDAVNEFRPYFDNAPVYGHGPSLEDFTEQTPLTVGSPQQVIDPLCLDARVLRRLPAPAVPHGPRRPAAQDRARTARHPRRGGRARASKGVRGRPPRARPRTAPTHASLVAARAPGQGTAGPVPEALEGAAGGELVTARRLAVISAGLSQPSSTRLLAEPDHRGHARPPARDRHRGRGDRDRAAPSSRTTSPTTCSPGSRARGSRPRLTRSARPTGSSPSRPSSRQVIAACSRASSTCSTPRPSPTCPC